MAVMILTTLKEKATNPHRVGGFTVYYQFFRITGK
jgi:hypothetical protein